MRLFKKKQESVPNAQGQTTCVHLGLTPKWANLEDMGNEEKATAYACATCGAQFSPDEAALVRSAQTEQLRKGLGSVR